ncbi:MAG TPA: STAS domain-containing protein [Rhizomicrobium sp.]|nr:STAS domain-containing protein [Rhizomicrobium sp.]
MSFMQDDGRGSFVLKLPYDGRGSFVLKLPSTLDLTAAAALKLDLQSGLARGEGLTVNAEDVRRVTSPCLQVLVSAARAFAQTGGAGLHFESLSPSFKETAAGLGLAGEFDIEGSGHE